MDRICSAQGEVNAVIIKDFLESQGIKSSYAPDDSPFFLASGASKGPTQVHSIYVERDKMEQAFSLLKKEGLLNQ